MNKIYKDLAAEHELPVEEIKKICESPFLFLKEKMTNRDFNEDVGEDLNFNLKYLGMFHVNPKRREYLKKKFNGFKIKNKR